MAWAADAFLLTNIAGGINDNYLYQQNDEEYMNIISRKQKAKLRELYFHLLRRKAFINDIKEIIFNLTCFRKWNIYHGDTISGNVTEQRHAGVKNGNKLHNAEEAITSISWLITL